MMLEESDAGVLIVYPWCIGYEVSTFLREKLDFVLTLVSGCMQPSPLPMSAPF